jgi:hypothetical protein
MYKKIACIVLFIALSLTVQYAQSQLEKGLTVINKNNLQKPTGLFIFRLV